MSRRVEDADKGKLDIKEITKGNMSGEAMRLMENHRTFYHIFVKKDCKICRSFRRTILGGLSK